MRARFEVGVAWMILKMALALVLSASVLVQTGCGVKGDPLPPLEPAHLGRGEPQVPNKRRFRLPDPDPGAVENQ